MPKHYHHVPSNHRCGSQLRNIQCERDDGLIIRYYRKRSLRSIVGRNVNKHFILATGPHAKSTQTQKCVNTSLERIITAFILAAGLLNLIKCKSKRASPSLNPSLSRAAGVRGASCSVSCSLPSFHRLTVLFYFTLRRAPLYTVHGNES